MENKVRRTKIQANADAAIPSNSGVWKIMNYTRYLTSDLVEVVNIVEAEALKCLPKGVPLVGERMSQYRPVSQPDVLFFDTYSGDNKKAYDGSLFYVKPESWSERNMIRIVPPDRLGISNVEMLAATRNNSGGHPVPESVVLQIVKAIAGKYDGSDPNYVHTTGSSRNDANFFTHDALAAYVISKRQVPKIRFLDKPENKKVAIVSGDARLRGLAQDKATDAISSIQYGERQIDRAKCEILQLNRYLTKCSGETPVDTAPVCTALAQIKIMLNALNNKLNTIKADE